ncbi:ABC transporter permease [Rhodobacter sp. 24-YEA-8]|uniref:ABC transporter permease n=1 Tax=Rhodobacter sp. 24-YEA-8 TaxID=1884310 RepID=UPI000897BB9F|nr:ABC transporter permease [Rhodobacter sp. 24-YEA-8]SED39202.1 peptide/nickel transport system permease protein [Rhodobacter sp. 24-YEA-8]
MLLRTFLLRRLTTTLVTLFLASLLVFAACQLLPGDIGRAVLGPFAAPEAVAALNARLGTDQPAHLQYLRWFGGLFEGSLGVSLSHGQPVAPMLWAAMAQSAQLALVVVGLLVPLAMAAGIWAGLRKGKLIDRVILLTGISLATVPDFVTALLLVILFSLWLGWLPVSGPPDGAGAAETLRHLILPALPLVINLLGYIARIVRAGVIRASEADFTRAAILKGLPFRIVLLRHILPNALAPAVAVLATQISNLLGGIVVIEALFNIQGLGALVAQAAKGRDYPTLQAGVLAMVVIYAVVTLLGDLLQLILDPRQRERPGG